MPLSWLYGLGVWVRNELYDSHVLRSRTVPIPTIGVGNLAVGGTGKTPMTEYIVSLLVSHGYHVAILSRGYGRTTKGFRLANANDTALTIGDEPAQMHARFPEVPMAVCADRVQGVRRLQSLFPDLQCVVLDDVFQHRRLRCGYYVLLTPYDRLYVHDHLLPRGRLRDLPSQSLRANTVVVTKCPPTMRPIDCRVVSNALRLPSYQHLCFASIGYPALHLAGTPLLVTGIAHPEYMLRYVQQQYPEAQLLTFPDHHAFTDGDIETILARAAAFDTVLTTEKDYARLLQTSLPERLGDRLQVLPIHIDLGGDKAAFDREILLYVAENNRHTIHPSN